MFFLFRPRRTVGIACTILWTIITLFLICYSEDRSLAPDVSGAGDKSPLEPKLSNETKKSEHGSPILKVPYPILVASLPKSGTTSIARMFYCGKVATAHTFANTDDGRQMRIGECFQSNVAKDRPPLEGCGNYDVWSDNGLIRGNRCYYPSVHGLDAFYKHYPSSTILLVKRKKEFWRKSMRTWKNGALVNKWKVCSSEFPPKRANDNQLEDFYEQHAKRIREFVKMRPSLSYIEVQLEDEDVGEQLEKAIGIDQTCLKHHNSHEKRLRLNPKFRKQWEEQQRIKAVD